MSEQIDWQEVRKRIQQKPVIVPPKHVKHPNRSPESIEKRRAQSRKRSKEYRLKNPEKVHAAEKAWRTANPEKVKAKKKRFYEKHKTDPEWLEKKRARQREYKRRKKLERLCYNAA